ncbi:hypothetical protein niasHT_005089 [Heterodera trifolii]|uniref:CCHC-type domain-containing protein n=1 Tax=Heterodera trifolii TaxID=157864 RepID=A0ABD2MEN3_9BILA
MNGMESSDSEAYGDEQHTQQAPSGSHPETLDGGKKSKVTGKTTTRSELEISVGAKQTGGTPVDQHSARANIAVRTSRDQIERAAGTLAARIAEARETLDEDMSDGEAAQHAAKLMVMQRGLREAATIFQRHFNKGIAAVGDAPYERQNELYDFLTAELPTITNQLRLNCHPTPAETLQIAAEHIGDLRMLRLTLEDEDRESSRPHSGGSNRTEGSLARGDDPRPFETRHREDWDKSFQAASARWQPDATADPRPRQDHQPIRVPTPMISSAAQVLQRRAIAPSVASLPINPTREWVDRNSAQMGVNPQRRITQPITMLGQPTARAGPTQTNTWRDRQPPDMRRERQGGAPCGLNRLTEQMGQLTTFETVRLQPPTFSGKAEDWTTFWAYFKRAVDEKPIPGVEKQLHLLRCLKEGSPARRAVEVYPPTDGNYPVVVQLLKERFGNTNDLQRAIRAQLLHLPPAKDTVASLTAMIDEFERGVCQLEQLGANVDDASFGPLLEAKLPVRILTELRIRESTMGAEWTVREFRKAVAAQAKCMRAAESALAAMKEPERRQDHRTENDRAARNGRQGKEGFQRAFMIRDSVPERRQPTSETKGRAEAANYNRQGNANATKLGSYSRPVGDHSQAQVGRSGQSRWGCSLCGQLGHQPSRCTKYESAQAKRKRLMEQHRCLKCLGSDHTAPQCSRRSICRTCQQTDHHWLICWKSERGAVPTGPAQERTNRTMMVNETEQRGTRPPSAIPVAGDVATTDEGQGESPSPGNDEPRAFATMGQQLPAYLMVCPVVVAAEDGSTECRSTLLLDPASHGDYGDTALITQLGLEKVSSEQLTIQVFGGKKVRMPSGRYKAKLKRLDGGWETIELSEVPTICTPIRTELVVAGGNPEHTKTIMETVQPQILIGIRRFWDFVRGFRKTEEGTYLIETVFGAVLCGEQFQTTTGIPPDSSVFAIPPCGEDERDQMPSVKAIEQFWSVEAIGIRDDPTEDADTQAVIQFERSVRQQADGRYSIRLPWREEHPELPSNYAVAYRRLIGLLQRLQKTPEVLTKYQQVIEEQFGAGVIEETTIGTGRSEYFIPHQAVITPKKLRVVYDASAHAKGAPSLNDCLLRGPVWLPDLAGMLIRFRACQVPVIADVEKAFLMVGIEEADREVCKFLWVRDPFGPLTTSNLVPYRFRRLAFGLTPSPFCLAAVVRHHLRKYGTDFAEQLIRDTYVDNVLIPADTVEEATERHERPSGCFPRPK